MRIGAVLGFLVWGTVLGGMGYFLWSMHDAQQETRRLRESLARFMSEERVARFIVHDVRVNTDTGQKSTVIWWEEKRRGQQPAVKELLIKGDSIYFDTLQINFDPRFVKEGDPLRGKSLILLRRAYALEETADGNLRIPEGGVVHLDVPDSIARALTKKDRERVTGVDSVPEYFEQDTPERTELERDLWSKIWELATDPQMADANSVRTAQWKAVGKPLVKNMEYRLKLSPTGQLDLLGPIEPDTMIQFDRRN